MHGAHTQSSGSERRIAAQREENIFFAGFTFSGNQRLKALTTFYGLTVPGVKSRTTLAEYLAQSCYGDPRPGYRIGLGRAELIVRATEEGAITRVGLRLVPPAPHRHERRWPFGTRYIFGASIAQPGHALAERPR